MDSGPSGRAKIVRVMGPAKPQGAERTWLGLSCPRAIRGEFQARGIPVYHPEAEVVDGETEIDRGQPGQRRWPLQTPATPEDGAWKHHPTEVDGRRPGACVGHRRSQSLPRPRRTGSDCSDLPACRQDFEGRPEPARTIRAATTIDQSDDLAPRRRGSEFPGGFPARACTAQQPDSALILQLFEGLRRFPTIDHHREVVGKTSLPIPRCKETLSHHPRSASIPGCCEKNGDRRPSAEFHQ